MAALAHETPSPNEAKVIPKKKNSVLFIQLSAEDGKPAQLATLRTKCKITFAVPTSFSQSFKNLFTAAKKLFKVIAKRDEKERFDGCKFYLTRFFHKCYHL